MSMLDAPRALADPGETALRPRHPYRDVPLVILTAVGRSGTNAVRRALSLHPDIDSTGNENNIIHELLGVAWKNETHPPRRYAMRVSSERYRELFASMILDLLWPEPRSHPPARLLAFSGLTTDQAEYLAMLFPQRRILYLLRNGIEVVSSRMLYDSFKDLPFENHCQAWAGAAPRIRWGAQREDFLLLRHESLLEPGSAAPAVDAVWSFLDLPPHAPGLASLLEQARPHPTAHPDEPIAESYDLRTRSERWRFWTEEQRDTFVRICGEAMDELGYLIPWTTGRS